MDLQSSYFFKGRVAEAIVEAMLEEMGWKVYRYGAEFTANAVLDKSKPNTGTAALRVRRMPDFIIQKESDVHLIEVKYRSEGQRSITVDNIEEWKEPLYPEAYVIMVSPKNGIMMQKAKDIYAKKYFPFLTDFPELGFDGDIVVKYYNLAQRIFTTIEDALAPSKTE